MSDIVVGPLSRGIAVVGKSTARQAHIEAAGTHLHRPRIQGKWSEIARMGGIDSPDNIYRGRCIDPASGCVKISSRDDRMPQLYDEIGIGYGNYRRPDPRLAAAILHALGEADTVVNVGAGAGSYEPTDRSVVAVEPSLAMIRQRRRDSVVVVQASATHLPFRDAAFAAALTVLTVHHWSDRARGLTELARVAQRRVVIVTWDPAASGFWLIDDYFPEIGAIDRRIMPSIKEFQGVLGDIEMRPLLVPHDCTDGFLGAYWQRPYAYLDAGVRSAISTFSKLSDVESGLARLRRDLENGTWEHRYRHLALAVVSDAQRWATFCAEEEVSVIINAGGRTGHRGSVPGGNTVGG
jgi:SAM-dependent methyltransferase